MTNPIKLALLMSLLTSPLAHAKKSCKSGKVQVKCAAGSTRKSVCLKEKYKDNIKALTKKCNRPFKKSVKKSKSKKLDSTKS